MNFPKIWLSSPHMGEFEFEFVKEAFDQNWIAPLGPNVDGFEFDIESYNNIRSAGVFSSGTSALHLALILLNIQQDDEVICQSFTFSASANPIVYQKALPIFIDSEPDTWNMCPNLLEEAITDRINKGKKPKAIIPVHLYGMPAKMNEICDIANKYEIPIIEDAAESLGSSIDGKKCGTFGTLGILSFNGNKIITTSGGGALISQNSTLIDKAKFLSTQARDPAPHYQHSHIGYNYRMSNICAGIGRGQMKVLDERIKKRRENFNFYKEVFSKIPSIKFLEEPLGYYSNRWLTTILIDNHKIDSQYIRAGLEKVNIESRPLWKPMHLQPIFKDAPFYGNGISETLFNKGLCLPSGSNLTESDLNRISDKIISYFI